MTPQEAYWYAFDNSTKPGFYLESYQEIACKDSRYAYLFARDISGADISYCQKFALYFPRADIEYCQEHACRATEWAYHFACNIPGADIAYCRKVCEHDEYWLNRFNKMLIKKAML